MAEENAENAPQPKGSRRPLLMMGLVGLLALLLGAGATYFVVNGKAAAEDEKEEAEPAPQPVPFTERLVSLEPFVVNVTGDAYPRFLKVRIELELDKPEYKQVIEERMAQIRDSLIVLITSKRLSDVSEFEGKALLKEEILERLNGLLGEPMVRSVLFTEFVVQ